MKKMELMPKEEEMNIKKKKPVETGLISYHLVTCNHKIVEA